MTLRYEFKTTGVAGAGTMGIGIAITIARAGLPITLFDVSQAALDRGRQQIADFFDMSVAKGKANRSAADASIANIRYSGALRDLAPTDIVVEAIYEDPSAKRALLQALSDVCAPETLFLSNTSTLSITELAAASGRPDRVVGTHYCLPAQLMKLVEMSRGIHTADTAWDKAWAFQRATGQHPVETRDRPGFVLNFFCIPYHNDAIRLVEAGVAEPRDIDRAMKASMGFAMGPCELIDLIGLDTQLRASEAFFASTNDPRAAPPPLLRRMVSAGLLGRKAKRGFYSYGRDTIFGA